MKLNFFTATFPYYNGETFIENEIQFLSNRFQHVEIFPFMVEEEQEKRKIPKNCHITLLRRDKKMKISDFIILFRILWIEFWQCPKKIFFIRKIRYFASLTKQAILVANWLEKSGIIDSKTLCYSFWMNDWALVLTVLKMRSKIDKFIFRCGGFDIWNERHENNYLPFRGVIYKYSSGIFPNSKQAEIYLKALNIYPEKVKCKYWGTMDMGLSPFNEKEQFTIVSCSSLIPLKRVHLIIEILEKLSKPVNWIHFGDGPLMEELKALAKNKISHHHFQFKGDTPNSEILNYYSTHHVNLFITTSSTEGLPVTLQEATSFGIPCLATNVGGVSEVVNNETGMLVNANINSGEIAKLISKFEASEKNSRANHLKVRNQWEQKFNAAKTYNEFIDNLKLL